MNSMKQINWLEEVEKYKENIITDTQQLLRIKSVLDPATASAQAPFGAGIDEALKYLLEKGKNDGFAVKNVDGYAGHIEWGEGEKIVGVLCHVDVVPEGDGWTSDPYGAEIKDGKIIARGALDDKGPTIAAYYALKIVKELKLPLKKRTRIIIGTDEESKWRCVKHYFDHEKMPDVGFAPDADFPIIFAEKGIADIIFKGDMREDNSDDKQLLLRSFQSGHRLNMVPDAATAAIVNWQEDAEIIDRYTQFLRDNRLEGEAKRDGENLLLTVIGKSAHAMEPKAGINAGLKLVSFLKELTFQQSANDFIQFLAAYFADDTRGNALGVAAADDISGELTVNVGIMEYSASTGGTIGIDIRYPVALQGKQLLPPLTEKAKEFSYHIATFDDSPAHHVDKTDPFIQTLARVYEEQTRNKAEFLAIGGGTYARALKKGVAFGPVFPGREDVAHQKDEYIYIEDLLKATAIYAQAIYELCQ